jgi:rhodanese-related sulfurtransferase
MNDDLNKLDKKTTYHIHCEGGYRSVIAISLLMKNGYSKLIDVTGGFGKISKTDIPKTTYVCPSRL